MLVIGAGRVGAWHVAVAKDLLPKTKIYLADIDRKNLNTVGNLFNVPEKQRYLVSKNKRNPYSKKNLESHFGKDCLFDFIVDAAGHHALAGKTITELLRESVAKGGAFCTTSHTGIKGVDAGHPEIVLGMKRFLNGLSPQNNFGYAISYLAKNLKKYEPFLKEIKGGLSKELAHIIETGGGPYKKKMKGTTFYSVVNKIDF